MLIAWFGKSCICAFLSEGHGSDPLQGSQAIFRERPEWHFLGVWRKSMAFFIENSYEGARGWAEASLGPCSHWARALLLPQVDSSFAMMGDRPVGLSYKKSTKAPCLTKRDSLVTNI